MQRKEIKYISIDLIERNNNQPRKTFTEEGLEELTNSIKEHGIIQPIVVTKKGDKYMIIAGERRFRASLRANLIEIPCIVESLETVEIQEIALIENLHRMKDLLEFYDLTQEELSIKIGKSRAYIANMIRLLSLPEEVRQMLIENKITAGHARALLSIQNKDELIRIAKKIVEKNYNVRDVENEVKLLEIKSKPILKQSKKPQQKQTLEMKNFINDLKYVLATSVKIIGNEHKGRIYIDYYSTDDLTRIANLLDLYKRKIENI